MADGFDPCIYELRLIPQETSEKLDDRYSPLYTLNLISDTFTLIHQFRISVYQTVLN